MAEFNFELIYNPDRHNAVADALSRKAQLGTIVEEAVEPSNSQVELTHEMVEKIKEGLEADTQAHRVVLQVRADRTRKFDNYQWLALLCR